MTIQPLSELAGLMGLGGLGQTGIPPGNQCYDATHDPGEIHCSNATDVIFSAIPLIGGGAATTDCSTSETACLAANPGAVTPDICSGTLGVSCTTLAMLMVLVSVGLVIFNKVK